MGILIRLLGYGTSGFGLYIFAQQVLFWSQAKVWLTLPLSNLFFGPSNQSADKMVPFHFGLNMDQWATLYSILDYIPLSIFWIALGVVISAQGVRVEDKFKV